MADFIPGGSGRVTLRLDAAETDVIRQLADEFMVLLSAGPIDRTDPVHDRLFPSAYEDASDEAKYRDLIGDDLVAHKIEALETVSESLGRSRSEIALDEESLGLWLACLTDLRLAIGTRLEVDEDMMSNHVRPRDPNAQSLAILHWLGWLQEGILQAMST